MTSNDDVRAQMIAIVAEVADVDALASRPLHGMAATIARMYRLGGPVVTVPAACAAGKGIPRITTTCP